MRVDVEQRGEEAGEEMLVDILDADGQTVASARGCHTTIQIPDAKLWDADHPACIGAGADPARGKAVDESSVSFGLRQIAWGSEGFSVNGQTVLLRGGCIHHDNGVLGACDFRDAEWRRVRIMKEAGFNAIRSAHNPISKDMLEACDALGMYVMDETFDMWIIHKNPYDYGDEAFRQLVETGCVRHGVKGLQSSVGGHVLHRKRNLGTGSCGRQEICRQMADFIRDMDKSRAITCGINLMLATMAAKGKGLYGTDKDGKEKQTGSQSMDSVPTSTVFNLMMNKMGGIMDKMASGKAADKVADAVDPFLDIPGYNYATSRYRKELEKEETAGKNRGWKVRKRGGSGVENMEKPAGELVFSAGK